MKCPNCSSEKAEQKGNKVFCPDCNATYKLEPDGAKVDDVDVLDKVNKKLDSHDRDIEKLKKITLNGKSAAGPDLEEPAEDTPGLDDLTDPDDPNDPDNYDADGCETNLFPE